MSREAAAALASWQHVTGDRSHTRNRLQQMVVRVRNAAVVAAVDTWLQVVEAQKTWRGILMKGRSRIAVMFRTTIVASAFTTWWVGIAEKVRVRKILGKATVRMQCAAVSCAWEGWKKTVVELKRYACVVRRVGAKLLQREVAYTFDTWQQQYELSRRLGNLVRTLHGARVARALHTWLWNSLGIRRRVFLLSRALVRLHSNQIAKALGGWLQYKRDLVWEQREKAEEEAAAVRDKERVASDEAREERRSKEVEQWEREEAVREEKMRGDDAERCSTQQVRDKQHVEAVLQHIEALKSVHTCMDSQRKGVMACIARRFRRHQLLLALGGWAVDTCYYARMRRVLRKVCGRLRQSHVVAALRTWRRSCAETRARKWVMSRFVARVRAHAMQRWVMLTEDGIVRREKEEEEAEQLRRDVLYAAARQREEEEARERAASDAAARHSEEVAWRLRVEREEEESKDARRLQEEERMREMVQWRMQLEIHEEESKRKKEQDLIQGRREVEAQETERGRAKQEEEKRRRTRLLVKTVARMRFAALGGAFEKWRVRSECRMSLSARATTMSMQRRARLLQSVFQMCRVHTGLVRRIRAKETAVVTRRRARYLAGGFEKWRVRREDVQSVRAKENVGTRRRRACRVKCAWQMWNYQTREEVRLRVQISRALARVFSRAFSNLYSRWHELARQRGRRQHGQRSLLHRMRTHTLARGVRVWVCTCQFVRRVRAGLVKLSKRRRVGMLGNAVELWVEQVEQCVWDRVQVGVCCSVCCSMLRCVAVCVAACCSV